MPTGGRSLLKSRLSWSFLVGSHNQATFHLPNGPAMTRHTGWEEWWRAGGSRRLLVPFQLLSPPPLGQQLLHLIQIYSIKQRFQTKLRY